MAIADGRAGTGSGTGDDVASASPAARPLAGLALPELGAGFEQALAEADGALGAHFVHELWMRGETPMNIDLALGRLWECAPESIPEWLPMRHIQWLPLAYEVAGRFQAAATGRSHIYLVLLDYSDRHDEPHGVYVGMTRHQPSLRFDQHKAGIRAAGSVLKRGLELLTGPVLHLQWIAREEALRIEEQLAEALRAEGLCVRGGH